MYIEVYINNIKKIILKILKKIASDNKYWIYNFFLVLKNMMTNFYSPILIYFNLKKSTKIQLRYK